MKKLCVLALLFAATTLAGCSGTNRLKEVDLRPGTYRAWCPLDDHAVQGMEATFVVR